MTEQEQHLEPSKRKAYLMALRDLFAARNPSANGFELWWDIATANPEDRITVIDSVRQSKEDHLIYPFSSEDGLNFNTGRD